MRILLGFILMILTPLLIANTQETLKGIGIVILIILIISTVRSSIIFIQYFSMLYKTSIEIYIVKKRKNKLIRTIDKIQFKKNKELEKYIIGHKQEIIEIIENWINKLYDNINILKETGSMRKLFGMSNDDKEAIINTVLIIASNIDDNINAINNILNYYMHIKKNIEIDKNNHNELIEKFNTNLKKIKNKYNQNISTLIKLMNNIEKFANSINHEI